MAADQLTRYGVTHVVTTSPELWGELRSADRFDVVWRDPPLAILAVLPSPGQPDPSSLITSSTLGLSARLIDPDPDHPRIRFTAPSALVARVAIGWSPKWRGSIDGRSVRISQSTENLLEVSLPPGRHDLSLDYGADSWDLLGRGISLLGLAGAGVGFWTGSTRRTPRAPRRGAHRRSRGGSPPPS